MSTKKGRYGNPAKRRPLTGDLQKLVQPTGLSDPRKLGGNISLFGGPREQGASLLDMTDAVILEGMNVCTVDKIHQGINHGQAIFMTLEGRINKKTDQVTIGFMFGPDGAAALITELLALADRFGAELLSDVTSRLATLQLENNIDLHFLKAAIDLAIEETS